MTTETRAIQPGDIFHWRHKDDGLHSEPLSYWAKSRIAIAGDGVLRDTYWSSTDGRPWTFEGAEKNLILTHIANFADLERVSEYEATFYADSDIVNLNHGNSREGNCYRRKGSERSRAAMIDKVNRHIEKAKAEIRSAQRDVERLEETKRTLQSGADLKGIWI